MTTSNVQTYIIFTAHPVHISRYRKHVSYIKFHILFGTWHKVYEIYRDIVYQQLEENQRTTFFASYWISNYNFRLHFVKNDDQEKWLKTFCAAFTDSIYKTTFILMRSSHHLISFIGLNSALNHNFHNSKRHKILWEA